MAADSTRSSFSTDDQSDRWRRSERRLVKREQQMQERDFQAFTGSGDWLERMRAKYGDRLFAHGRNG